MSGITLHARPPWSTFCFHHTVLSVHKGILLLIQFSLLRQELLLISMMTVGSTTTSGEALNRRMGRGQCRDKGADLDEQQRRAGTYLNAGGSQLRETSVPAQRVDNGLASRQGLLP
jgi:hypothetical protein